MLTNLERRFVIRGKDGKTQWVNVRNGINDKIEILELIMKGDTLSQKRYR
jgi:hypothetical protein